MTLSGRFDKKSSKIMPLKEIEKLREKVEKDPNSKLFVTERKECSMRRYRYFSPASKDSRDI